MAKMDHERPKYRHIDFEYDIGSKDSSRYKTIIAKTEAKRLKAKKSEAEDKKPKSETKAKTKRVEWEINTRVIFLSRILMKENHSSLLELPNPIENVRKIYCMNLPIQNEADFDEALLKNKNKNLVSFIQQYMDMNHDGVNSLYYLIIAIDRLINID